MTPSALACRALSNKSASRAAPSPSSVTTSKAPNADAAQKVEGVWLGTASALAAPLDPDADEANVERPFSVELGTARGAFNQFAVPALETRQAATFATITLVDSDVGTGRSVELGRVYGDVEPPALTTWEAGFAVLSADHDASALALRLYTLSAPFDGSGLKKGPEIRSVRRDTQGFALEAHGHEALAVYSKLEKGKGTLGLSRFDLRALTAIGGSTLAPHGGEGDQESPRLIAREGGYYLAWLLRTFVKPRVAPRLAARAAKDGDSDRPEEPVLEEGPSAIEIVPLDGAGVAVASPRRVTPPEAHVTSFDMAPTRDSGALVVYRDERDGPGLDRANIEAIWVRPDGSSTARTWELSESVGLPSLLVDPGLGKDQPFIAVSVQLEAETRLAHWDETTAGLLEPSAHEALGNRELLARVGERYLTSEVRGSQRHLGVISCRFLR
ncbi:MAG TPA: hypothetical protein VFQ61_20815 [Polyangiaceae bacterium]|nr:hypothetical protein [Polyangiaceae bacterium]